MRLFIFFLLFALALPGNALGAFKSSSDLPTPQSAWNPVAMNDDLILPMPCGLGLAMRGAVVHIGSLIRDRTFTMGITNPQDAERQIYERQFAGHISAPFTRNDLPEKWAKILNAASASQSDAWYFMGKYEISRLQWDAVMGALTADGLENPAQCPKIAADSNLPATNISWFEAQEFLNKYNAWLIRNHKELLPAFADSKNVAFLRLPTEEEWEYAARGGARVAPEWWVSHDFFPPEEGRKISDYGIYNSGQALKGPAPIGSRNCNPLGLYDTAGNASEMVDGFFRMSIVDVKDGRAERRLHGAAGGILTKGGSYMSNEAQIMPGWRDEAPLYTSDGPGRRGDLGLRVVLAGINFPNAQRLETMRNEESAIVAAGSQKAAVNIDESTPLEAIAALADAADGDMKRNLLQLREKLKDRELADAAAESKNLENTFRSLLYQAETLRAFAYRYSAVNGQLAKINKLLEGDMSAAEKKEALQLKALSERHLSDYFESLQMGANYYKSNLVTLLRDTPKELARLAAQASAEYSGKGVFNSHMRQNIQTLEDYLATARTKGLDSLTPGAILKGILPADHYKQLPL